MFLSLVSVRQAPRHPFIAGLGVGAFDRGPRLAVRNLFLPAFTGVRRKGVVERLPVDIPGVQRRRCCTAAEDRSLSDRAWSSPGRLAGGRYTRTPGSSLFDEYQALNAAEELTAASDFQRGVRAICDARCYAGVQRSGQVERLP